MSGAEIQAGSEFAAGGPEPGKLHCYLFSKQNVKVNCDVDDDYGCGLDKNIRICMEPMWLRVNDIWLKGIFFCLCRPLIGFGKTRDIQDIGG